MKRFFALLLVLCMLAGLAAPALAAEQTCLHEDIEFGTCEDCGRQFIVKNPSVYDPSVQVKDVKDATFQWYAIDILTPVTDEVAVTAKNTAGEYSAYENGRWLPARDGVGNEFGENLYFHMELKKGDLVLAYRSNHTWDEELYMRPASGGEEVEPFTPWGDGIRLFFAREDGVHVLTGTTFADNTVPTHLDGDGDSVRAWHFNSDNIRLWKDPKEAAVAVEGETSYRLSGGEAGKFYFCRVTYKDGTVVDSESFFFRHAIAEFPTYEDPTVVLNSNAAATIEWLRLYYEEEHEITENFKPDAVALSPLSVLEDEFSYRMTYHPITLSAEGVIALEFDGNVYDVTLSDMEGIEYDLSGAGSYYESARLSPGSYIVTVSSDQADAGVSVSAIGGAAIAGNSPYDAARGFLGEKVSEIDFGKSAYRYFTVEGLDEYSNDYSYIVTVEGEYSDVFLYDYRNRVRIPYRSRSGDAFAFFTLTETDAYSLIVLTEDGAAVPTVKAECVIDDVIRIELTDKVLSERATYTEAEGWRGAMFGDFEAGIYMQLDLYAGEPIVLEINGYRAGMDPELFGANFVSGRMIGKGQFLFVSEYGGLYNLAIDGAGADTTVRVYRAELSESGQPILKEEIKGTAEVPSVSPPPAVYVEGHGWNGRFEEMLGITTLFTVEVPVEGAVAVEAKEGLQYLFGTLENELYTEYVDGKIFFYNHYNEPFVGTLRAFGPYGNGALGVRAYLYSAGTEVLKNETGATLNRFLPSILQGYAVRVTFADGTVESCYVENWWEETEVSAERPIFDKPLGESVTYQWYAADEVVPLTDERARAIDRDAKGRYTKLLGWEGVYDALYGTYLFFETELKKGEAILVYDGDMQNLPMLYNSASGERVDFWYYDSLGAALLVAPEDGTYIFGGSRSLKSLYSADVYYAKAHILTGFEAVEGETDRALGRMDANTYYYCVATQWGGAIDQSATFFAEPLITHAPTVSEPYVAVNLASGVTYQWYELFGAREKLLDRTMASPVVFGEGENAAASSYNGDYGWLPAYNEEDGYYYYFTVALRRGERLKIETGLDTVLVYDGKTYREIDSDTVFTADADATYTFVSPDFDALYVMVTALRLEGETAAAITAPVLDKRYEVVAYAGDAAVSATLDYAFALAAPMDAASPTVKTNAPADMPLIYEWYKDNGTYANVDEDCSFDLLHGHSYNGVFESEYVYNDVFTYSDVRVSQKIELELHDTSDIDTVYITLPEGYKGKYEIDFDGTPVFATYGKAVAHVDAPSVHITVLLSETVNGVLIEAGAAERVLLSGETAATLSADAMAEGGRFIAAVRRDPDSLETFFVKDASDAYGAYLGYTEATDKAAVDTAYAEVDLLANGGYLVGREYLAVTAAYEHLSDLIAARDKHVHTYGSTLSHDQTHHYLECTDPDCPVREYSVKDQAAHQHDNACDASCNVCGAPRTPAEHAYGAAVVTREATAREDGEYTYTCSVCGATRTETFAYDGLGTGAIVAISAGAAAVAGGGFSLLWFVIRRKRAA